MPLRLFTLILFTFPALSHAQDSILNKLPSRYLSQIEQKSGRFEERVNKRSEKALNRLSKQEMKMQAKLSKIDTIAAKNIFTTAFDKIGVLRTGLKSKVPKAETGYLDTLQNTLTFLHATNTLQSVQQLQGQLQQAEQIQTYIRERKEQLKQQLAQYTGFTKNLQQINKEAYYYGEQLREYKSLFQDKKKAEAKAIALLKKIPAYNTFIQQHSQLSSLFSLISTTQTLEGLQTRTQVEQLIQQRIGSSPSAQQAVSQAMDQARSKFSELKSKFPDLDNAADMPDFKPNPLKTKSFLQRLEFGGNIQFQKSNKYFPTYADIAGQVAYKFHKNGSFGFGIAYKLGMGKGWDHIAFNQEGVGLRSFLDWKLKGSFFVNGGFEENYQTTFTSLNIWKGSALLGICKKYKINAKLKGNIMVLYDFLAPHQLPQTDNIKVRIGYSL
jgi:hypothetical protein